MSEYAHPDVLVDTAWVAAHLNDPKVRLIEGSEDGELYNLGHISGAVKLDGLCDLHDAVVRDYLDAPRFADLLECNGISNDTTVVIYGDQNNWWATYALWVFKLFGHQDVRIMNGGRAKWIAEGRPLTGVVPSYSRGNYTAPERDDRSLRAFRAQVKARIGKANTALIDVRSLHEFTGEQRHMLDYPQEATLRAGHIPTAVHIPWDTAVYDDGTFKAPEELKALYTRHGVTPDHDVITYCRIGERASHTWFVLHYLLGYPTVRNYDGGWTEWGNSVGFPIERAYHAADDVSRANKALRSTASTLSALHS